jgi:hypothetical protein
MKLPKKFDRAELENLGFEITVTLRNYGWPTHNHEVILGVSHKTKKGYAYKGVSKITQYPERYLDDYLQELYERFRAAAISRFGEGE